VSIETVLEENVATIGEVKKNTEQKMQKSVEALKADLSKVRTGRAHPGILDHVQVDYYGSMVPLSQVANVSLIDARTIGVTPWEKKMAAPIEKAIREADLGLNPSAQGDIIRIPMPPLTEERRRELIKVVKGEAEDARIAVRNLRRDANQALKEMLKAKSVPEDDERRAQDDVQKLTDKFIAEIEKMIQAKESELLGV
jgi:ribosome recycling factor